MSKEVNFGQSLTAFLDVVNAQLEDRYSRYNNLGTPTLEVKAGKKYVKIIRWDAEGTSGSILGFVSAVDNPKKGEKAGDILKAASWNASAKHPRGSIFSDQNGAEALTGDGFVRYL